MTDALTFWRSPCGSAEVFNARCEDVLLTFAADAFDAIVTDPPYGIDAGRMNLGKWRSSRLPKSGWDQEAPHDMVAKLVATGRPCLIFGGNYFALPPSRSWLVWNKGAGFKGRDFAEAELAWCNVDGVVRVIDHDPLARGDYKSRKHKAQKPVDVMVAALQMVGVAEGARVFDPYAGSGSTGVACARMGCRFVGVEVDERHFRTAVDRIGAELRRMSFLDPRSRDQRGTTTRDIFGG